MPHERPFVERLKPFPLPKRVQLVIPELRKLEAPSLKEQKSHGVDSYFTGPWAEQRELSLALAAIFTSSFFKRMYTEKETMKEEFKLFLRTRSDSPEDTKDLKTSVFFRRYFQKTIDESISTSAFKRNFGPAWTFLDTAVQTRPFSVVPKVGGNPQNEKSSKRLLLSGLTTALKTECHLITSTTALVKSDQRLENKRDEKTIIEVFGNSLKLVETLASFDRGIQMASVFIHDFRLYPDTLQLAFDADKNFYSVRLHPDINRLLQDLCNDEGKIVLVEEMGRYIVPEKILDKKVRLGRYDPKVRDLFLWANLSDEVERAGGKLAIPLRGMCPALVPEKILGNGMEGEYKHVIGGVHKLFIELLESMEP